MSEWSDEYKTKVRDFMARKGRPVLFSETSWDGTPEPSPYGWVDHDADLHCRQPSDKYPDLGDGCSWIVPEGAVLTEETYSQFTDTVSSNDNEVGSNASGCRCACGKYTDITLRWTGSVTEMLHDILGISGKLTVTL